MTNRWHALLAPIGVPSTDRRTLDGMFDGTRAERVPVSYAGVVIGVADNLTQSDGVLAATLTLPDAPPFVLDKIRDGELLPGFDLDMVRQITADDGSATIIGGRTTAIVLREPAMSSWPDHARLTALDPA